MCDKNNDFTSFFQEHCVMCYHSITGRFWCVSFCVWSLPLFLLDAFPQHLPSPCLCSWFLPFFHPAVVWLFPKMYSLCLFPTGSNFAPLSHDPTLLSDVLHVPPAKHGRICDINCTKYWKYSKSLSLQKCLIYITEARTSIKISMRRLPPSSHNKKATHIAVVDYKMHGLANKPVQCATCTII